MPPLHARGQEAELLTPPAGGDKPILCEPVITMMDCVGAVTAFAAVEAVDDGAHAGIQLPAAAGNRVFGVALKAGAIGDSVPVCVRGLCPITLGGTITAPAGLAANTDGDGIAATVDAHVYADLLEDGVDTNVKFCDVLGHGGANLYPASFSFAAAAGGANVAEVTATVLDQYGNTLAGVFNFRIWLSDAATGAGLTGTSASGTVTAKSASGAVIGTHTAKKALLVQTLAAGTFILEITDTAKTAFYVCAQVPSGPTKVATVLATGDYG